VSEIDAVVVGAGPNGLAAAVVLARAGLAVLLLERDRAIGGGMKTEALTLPGFAHDVCSAVHPLGADSPLFTALPLAEHGLEWIEPPIALAHPLDRDTPALLVRDVAATARSLGADADAYRALVEPIARHWRELAPDVLAGLHVPAHPLLYARFGIRGLPSAARVVRREFAGPQARALIGGIASHAMQPLTTLGTTAIALVLLATNHKSGWPIARGGSFRIAAALASYFTQLGGRIETGTMIRSFDDLPPARAVLLDLTPRQLLQIAGDRWPARYRRALGRFRYGPGVFKVDWALAAPVPWRDPMCHDAGTLHLAGTFDEIAAGEAAVARGEHPERPVVLLSQPSIFDPTRAPPGAHTLWGYCHVPAGSRFDMLPRIEAQIERFAPGFRDRVLARHVLTAADIEARNPNMVGGDIGEGANTLRQLFFRPTIKLNPYRTPTPGMYICSSSTPPGGGVHGLCGYHAARAALHEVFDIPVVPMAPGRLAR
jgi:phytoene dehydrogenase-like protein